MNYLLELRAFKDWCLMNQPSTGQIALWYALMQMANASGWQDWYSVPSQTLELLSGLSRSGIDKARKSLVDRGLIGYRPSDNRKKASKYKIIPLCQQMENKVDELGDELVDELATIKKASKETIIKQNKTKRNKEKDIVPFAEIVGHLNAVCGTKFKPSSGSTRKHINARWQEGYRLEDFKAVIDKKARDWLNDPDMSQYLRPETLFGTKFEGYLNQKGGQPRGAAKKPPADDWEEKFYTSGPASGT